MKRPGFSLIEVLVAMTLAFLLIIGTAELLTYSLCAKRKGDITAALTRALTDKLESLKSLPFEDAGLAPGRHTETERVSPGDCRVVKEWEVEDAGSGMKMVRLKVSNAGRPGPGVSATLFISRDLGFRP